jgi:undecaprenyl-diphosphatase
MIQGLKITFRVERPWIIDPSFQAVQEVIGTATGYSFPSGHTQSSTALFSSLALYVKSRRVKTLCVTAFLLVGMSRMYLGVHTPADVIVSMLLTLMVTVAVFIFMKHYNCTVKQNAAITAVIVILSAAVIIYSVTLFGRNLIEANYVSDCCKAAAAGLGFALGWYTERTFIDFDEHRGKWWQQVLKLVCGITVLLMIKEGLKIIFGTGIWVDIIRYFIMTVWTLILYPLILKNILSKNPVYGN